MPIAPKRINTTWLIFVTVLALMSVSIVMVYSSSAGNAARERVRKLHSEKQRLVSDEEAIATTSSHSPFFLRLQAFWAFIGITGLLVAYQIDYENYRKYSPMLIVGAFIACCLVYVPGIGIEQNYSKRWIGFGSIRAQPSEAAKLAMILYMARQLSMKQSDLKSLLRGFLPALGLLFAFLAVIVMEPDLGAAVMMGVIVFFMFYVSGMRIIHLASLFIVAVPGIAIAIISKPYRRDRWLAFLDPESDIQGKTYQIYQSLIAVSTGGVTGLGLGQGPQKYQFLSEPHTDFIFAIICEELGGIGAMSVFALYAFFIFQGLRVALKAPDLYGTLVATGITVMIGFQAFVNMGVVTGLLPTKGLTLPLISYGGSSLVINCVAVGVLMNVSKAAEMAASVPRRLQMTSAKA